MKNEDEHKKVGIHTQKINSQKLFSSKNKISSSMSTHLVLVQGRKVGNASQFRIRRL